MPDDPLPTKQLPPTPQQVRTILEHLTVPVMGCTEPAAVALSAALAASAARGLLPGWVRGRAQTPPAARPDDFTLEFLQVRTVPSLYKNALAVGIPNAEGGSGIYLAAALGPYLEAGAGLNLLKGCGTQALAAARTVLGSGKLALEVAEASNEGVFVEARIIGVFGSERHVGEAVLSGEHDQVTLLRRDGHVLFERRPSEQPPDWKPALQALGRCDLSQLVDLARNLDPPTRAHVLKGVAVNLNAAEVGSRDRLGLAVGATIEDLVAEGMLTWDLPTRARFLTAAATDARMSGHEVEVMSSSGSGNQGIMAVLPVAAAARHIGADDDLLAQGAALAHMITAVMTEHAGLLSAVCGCVVKAGMGAAAGTALALGLDKEGILAALKNMAGNMTGEICDGAKLGCAVKLCTAAGAAIQSALLARQGVAIPPSNGILAPTGREIFENIGALARAMKSLDRTIVALMERKQLRDVV